MATVRRVPATPMTLDQQIATLVAEAPADDPRLQVAIARGVAPAIRDAVARQLQHLEYQILQSGDRGDWAVTTLAHREDPQRQKRVIYAFATLADARTFSANSEPGLVAVPLPVVQLLFRVLSMPVDSLVFFDRPGNVGDGIEIAKADLQAQVQQRLLAAARSRTELA